jgi:hypothetical protein
VCARFERDHHNHLIRQFFHIRQLDSVSEYVGQFDSLMHQILAHDRLFSISAIVNRFVDGLRSDIKQVVFIHRPLDLDTAVSLALLQEELLTPHIKSNHQKGPEQAASKQPNRSQYTTSPPLSMPEVNSRTGGSEKHGMPDYPKQQSDQSKAAALMSYRRAKGLCYKCGLRWNPAHKCSPTVPLHMVEELWQLVGSTEAENEQSSLQEDSGEDFMFLSVNAVLGTEAPQTVKLLASIFTKKVIMLVDSGSSSSFISDRLANSHPNLIPLPTPVQVRVANGQVISCTHELPQCKVQLQGHCFYIDLKVLPLNWYDIILGMDWLSSHSPMHIHWQHKWLTFQSNGKEVVLQGLRSDNSNLTHISVPQLFHLQQQEQLWCVLHLQTVNQLDQTPPQDELPVEIQSLIQEFASLFDKPCGLPPPRSHCHSIPLIQGATPFRLRPYRYNPAQKDEIERQVADLLKSGMIQPSSSPFASPIILARKKTGDWRLCVDYRRLNALTVKNKYPLPIIDELLDELQGALWFTSLDLSSGYHQIQMDPQDVHKTAFQTHNGHYEYKVMPYGVTGGPATFQLAMNSVLSPFLRKCVVVFIDDILIYSSNWTTHLHQLRAVFATFWTNIILK